MLGIRIDQGWIGKCGSAVEAGIPTDTDSEATQTFRVVQQISSIVPEVPKNAPQTCWFIAVNCEAITT